MVMVYIRDGHHAARILTMRVPQIIKDLTKDSNVYFHIIQRQTHVSSLL